ncbi:MAG: class I SAM-dependent methyltransferase [Actinomycetota bacterium]
MPDEDATPVPDEDDRRRALAGKYDRIAERGYASRYADPGAIAERQVELLSSWGTPLPRGSRVLELGCADGFVTQMLVTAGFEVTAIDLSPGMIERARERLGRAGIHADLRVADLERLRLDDEYDAVLGLMWTFFAYMHEPARVLATLGERTRTKLLVDVNPRTHRLSDARRSVEDAGFASIRWRPFFVPQTHRVGRTGLAMLRAAERVPLLRDAALRRKFVAVVKGER